MKSFKERVLEFISLVPKGMVVSYGQVAAAAGSPRAARQVGGILKALPSGSKLPWWRVVNNEGKISIKGNWVAEKETQKKMLISEGVEVGKDFILDINKYRFKK